MVSFQGMSKSGEKKNLLNCRFNNIGFVIAFSHITSSEDKQTVVKNGEFATIAC